MSNNNNHTLGKAPWLHVIISTGLGSGFFPGAPGTFAGFIALAIWYALYLVLFPTTLLWVTLTLIVITTFVGVWTSNVMERYWGTDPRAVVIDEYVGTWIPLLVAPAAERTWIFAIIGFALFRIIDIFKPLGCRCPLSCFISYNSLVGYTYFNRNHNFCWRMDIKCYGKILGNRPTCGCY